VVVWDEVQTLHIAQQMSLPLTISCSSKSRLVLTCLVLPFWYLLTRVVPDIFQKSSKMVVCVCVSGQNGGRRGAMLTLNEVVFTSGGFVYANFGENLS